jgi:SNF2 family DNA or RNA helicase
MLQFSGQLYPFQEEVLKWTQTLKRGIIGLDMGLGKTVISIALVCSRDYQRTLIVLPLQIIEQWRVSFVRFTNLKPEEIVIYQGSHRKQHDLTKYRVILTTYDVVRRDVTLFPPVSCLILDEAHKIRNEKTQSYNTTRRLALEIPSIWLLTGTTIHNKYKDFHNLVEFLSLPSIKISDLKEKYYYRLTKQQVLLNLPEKVIKRCPLRFDDQHKAQYNLVYEDMKITTDDYKNHPSLSQLGLVMTKILRLRQVCNHPDASYDEEDYKNPHNRHPDQSSAKFTEILRILSQIPEGEKVIIFSQWRHTFRVLKTYLTRPVLEYNGKKTISDRNQVIQDFKQGPVPIMLITLTSGGVGLDLSCANHVIMIDSWWNQALEAQAIDRVYRIGQTKPVEVHCMYMTNSIEDWMLKMKEEKFRVDTTFHDESDIYSVNKEMLKELLHRFI